MKILKQSVAILLLVGLSASSMHAFGWNHSEYDEESLLKGALVVAVVGCAGTAYLCGSAVHEVFKNGFVYKAVAVKLVAGTILGLGAAGLVKLVEKCSGHFPG